MDKLVHTLFCHTKRYTFSLYTFLTRDLVHFSNHNSIIVSAPHNINIITKSYTCITHRTHKTPPTHNVIQCNNMYHITDRSWVYQIMETKTCTIHLIFELQISALHHWNRQIAFQTYIACVCYVYRLYVNRHKEFAISKQKTNR